MLWQRRMGHLNQQNLTSLANVRELELCEVCTASNMHEVAVNKKTDSRALGTSVTFRGHLKYRVCMVHAMPWPSSATSVGWLRSSTWWTRMMLFESFRSLWLSMEHRHACELTMELSIRQMHLAAFVENPRWSKVSLCSILPNRMV